MDLRIDLNTANSYTRRFDVSGLLHHSWHVRVDDGSATLAIKRGNLPDIEDAALVATHSLTDSNALVNILYNVTKYIFLELTDGSGIAHISTEGVDE